MNKLYYMEAGCAILCLLSIQTTTPYPIIITNETKEQINVIISYALAQSICPIQESLVEPGEKKIIDAGVCCAKQIEIIGTKGTLLGKRYTYIPPTTGFNISCRASEIAIKAKNGAFLVVEI